MNNSNICMVLCSCDSYEDTWVPFCKQLTKYWQDFSMPIYLCTEHKQFSYPGLDIRCPLSHGTIYKNWSERLIKLLNSIDSEFVLFMLDDFWIMDDVNVTEFNKILNYMENDRHMGFVCLKHEKRNKNQIPECQRRINCKYKELFRCLPKEPFRITTQVGIWRRKYLIKLLRKHESAWYFETRATWRSKFYPENIYDVKETVIKYPVGGVLGGGKFYRDYLPHYSEELTSECISKRGLISLDDKRSYPGIDRGVRHYYNIFRSVLPKW